MGETGDAGGTGQDVKPSLEDIFENAFLAGAEFRTITSAYAMASQHLGKEIKPNTLEAKDVEEAIEAGVVRAARAIVARGDDPATTYDDLRNLYDRQPTLKTSDSDSVARQAYSTPIHVAYAAAVMSQASQAGVVLEPTAGNGALLVTTDPVRQIVVANEIFEGRRKELETQGFTVTDEDASHAKFYGPDLPVPDVVLANPPYGTLKSGSRTRTWDFKNEADDVWISFDQVDQGISAHSLDKMRYEGRAALILGSIHPKTHPKKPKAATPRKLGTRGWGAAVPEKVEVGDLIEVTTRAGKTWQGTVTEVVRTSADGTADVRYDRDDKGDGARRKAYLSDKYRIFYNWLYSNFNVTAHYTIPGNVYRKQGAAWPVDFIIVEGKGKSALQQPFAEAPPIIDEDQLRQRMIDHADNQRNVPGIETTTPDGEMDTGRPDSETDRDGSGSPDGAGGSPEPAPLPPGVLPGGSDRGSDGNQGSGTSGVSPDTGQRSGEAGPSGGPIPGFERDGQRGRDDEGNTDDGLFPATPPVEDRAPDPIDEGLSEPFDDGKTQIEKLAEQAVGERQVKNNPISDGPSLDTLIPANQAVVAAEQVKNAGITDVDAFVQEKLAYASKEKLYEAFAAEQIDAVAMAIVNMEKDGGFILGDQTGIGKGRVMAGIMRYAMKQGTTVPVFVTAKPVLYADIWRDMKAICIPDMLGRTSKMLMTNAEETINAESLDENQ